MGPLQRKFKQVQLRQAWLRDPTLVLAKYREAMAGHPLQSPASLDQMIEAILDREEADHSTPSVMRAIAA
jgi:hypothetical protein